VDGGVLEPPSSLSTLTAAADAPPGLTERREAGEGQIFPTWVGQERGVTVSVCGDIAQSGTNRVDRAGPNLDPVDADTTCDSGVRSEDGAEEFFDSGSEDTANTDDLARTDVKVDGLEIRAVETTDLQERCGW